MAQTVRPAGRRRARSPSAVRARSEQAARSAASCARGPEPRTAARDDGSGWSRARWRRPALEGVATILCGTPRYDVTETDPPARTPASASWRTAPVTSSVDSWRERRVTPLPPTSCSLTWSTWTGRARPAGQGGGEDRGDLACGRVVESEEESVEHGLPRSRAAEACFRHVNATGLLRPDPRASRSSPPPGVSPGLARPVPTASSPCGRGRHGRTRADLGTVSPIFLIRELWQVSCL